MATNAKSQNETNEFQQMADKMFFNIFVHKPDSSIIFFINKYFPAFNKEFQSGGWSVSSTHQQELHKTLHSLIFKHHPYFEAEFSEGRLDLFASETNDGRPGIIDYRIWFEFETKNDGVKAFQKLSTMFDAVSKKKKIQEVNGRMIAEYTDQDILKDTNSVQFILMKDELYDNKYKLLFRIGAFIYVTQN